MAIAAVEERVDFRQVMREGFERRLDESAGFVVTSFVGIAHKPFEALRHGLQKSGGRFIVVKRAIFAQALKAKHLDSAAPLLNAQTGICFVGEDAFGTLRALVKFCQANEGFKICGGVWEDQLVASKILEGVAEFSSKEDIIARAAGNLKSPLVRLTWSLQAVLSQLVMALSQVMKKREERR